MAKFQGFYSLLPIFFLFGLTYGTVVTSQLKIKVSGRNLKHGILHSDDPYYAVFLSEDGGKTKTEIGRSEIITKSLNPEWKYWFEINFDRTKDQYLLFHVLDHDNLKREDTVGRVWLNLADYVDKGELAFPKLDKEGYLIVTTTKEGAAGTGRLPLPANVAESETLEFQLSARGLPTKDDVGFIKLKGDPYVLVDSIEGLSSVILKKVGRTSIIRDTKNPVWNDVLSFNWVKNKDQRIRFTIHDNDLIKDDNFDHVWMDVNDYVAKGQNYTLLLPKKGRLIITKVQ
ncbi:Protein BONZAI 3 [Orchesella cincta]|uniref:Protein BONZAI 3 n=1 Tax=Orchesella cincta TaxID=48709 RepID=A0A1D2MT99_ORCCI|nr:Protein BONZAI 3 [Orchesella cincta]